MKFLLLVFLLFGLTPARAQEMIKPPADSPETNVSERVRLLETEFRVAKRDAILRAFRSG